VWVQLTSEQRKHYKNLKEDFITWLNDQVTVSASTALVKGLRLLQLTNGFLKSELGDEIEMKNDPKSKALDEILENIGDEKVLVWSSFIKNYDMIKRVCVARKLPFVECHGGISNNKKFEAVERFRTDPKIRVFIGHPASLGIGINLVEARYMIYFSRGYSLEHDVQSEARNYRAGSEQHGTIIRYDIVAQDTIDEACFRAISDKQEMSLALLKNWVKYYANEENP
jgi:SNF2 family DNA or RNA helicase